ncbi:MAG: glutathione peroxidase [Aureispira sp.]
MAKSIHDFSLNSLQGASIDFSAYKGKKILLVNVASQCGLTPQYTQLETLAKAGADQLVVIGCPANNFGAQEPGTDVEIAQFCSSTYGISFPITTKISVTGQDQHALYQFVTQKEQNGVQDSSVQWNFQKYLLDEQGQLIQVFEPTIEPLDERILAATGVSL